MNEERFNELYEQVRNSTKQAFENIQENHKPEKIAAFALYSDNEGMTICTTACTKPHFDKLTDWIYFEEWDCEWEQIECLNKAQKTLSKIHEEFDQTIESYPEENQEELWRKHTNLIFSTFVKSLKSLVEDGVFGNKEAREDFFLNFDISDSGIPDETHRNWVEELNTENIFNKYKTMA